MMVSLTISQSVDFSPHRKISIQPIEVGEPEKFP